MDIMYGKHFESMYTGSMVGSGAVTFAVWGYVIAHVRAPDFTVELNPKLLAFILGEHELDVVGTISRLCDPDPQSRSKLEGGRRLVRRGEYRYWVVNAETYKSERMSEERRAYWREYKRKQRAKEVAKELQVPSNSPTYGERVEERQ